MQKLKRQDLLYPALSYQIIGVLFDVHNKLGPGYLENFYQRAISEAFKKSGLKFKEQVSIKLEGVKIASGFADFIIEDKVILEIKKGDRFLKNNIVQLYSYLKATGLNLGILANFSKIGLQFKRIVNIHS